MTRRDRAKRIATAAASLLRSPLLPADLRAVLADTSALLMDLAATVDRLEEERGTDGKPGNRA